MIRFIGVLISVKRLLCYALFSYSDFVNLKNILRLKLDKNFQFILSFIFRRTSRNLIFFCHFIACTWLSQYWAYDQFMPSLEQKYMDPLISDLLYLQN